MSLHALPPHHIILKNMYKHTYQGAYIRTPCRFSTKALIYWAPFLNFEVICLYKSVWGEVFILGEGIYAHHPDSLSAAAAWQAPWLCPGALQLRIKVTIGDIKPKLCGTGPEISGMGLDKSRGGSAPYAAE
jgi:hypothetical protein